MRNLKKWKKHPQVFIWTLSVPNFNLKWQILGSQSCPKVFWFFGFKTPGNENFEKMKKKHPQVFIGAISVPNFRLTGPILGSQSCPKRLGQTHRHTHTHTDRHFSDSYSTEVEKREKRVITKKNYDREPEKWYWISNITEY